MTSENISVFKLKIEGENFNLQPKNYTYVTLEEDCPDCGGTPVIHQEGCKLCPQCGYSAC